MKTKIIILFLLLLSLNSFAQGVTQSQVSQINFDKVTVEYYGAWQWLSNQHDYTLTELKTPSQATSFPLDIDDPTERFLVIKYFLGNVGVAYRIEALESATGGTDVVFNVQKNGQLCADGHLETLNRFSTKIIDLTRQCGIKFEAEYESLTSIFAESDVEIHKIEIDQKEIDKVKNAFLKDGVNAKKLDWIAGQVKFLEQRYRIVDLTNTNQFTPFLKDGQSTGLKVYTSPSIWFNEGDDSFNTRLLVVTDNFYIKKVILIENAVFEDLKVYNPVGQIRLLDYKSSRELAQSLNMASKFTQITGREAESETFWSEYLAGIGVPTTAAAIAGTGTGYVVGSSTVPLLAVAGTGAGLIVGGGVLAIAGSVWYFNASDTYEYDGLVINYDEEIVSPNSIGSWNEKKINFMIYKEQGADIIQPGQKAGKVKIQIPVFVQAIKTKFKDVQVESYKRLAQNPIEGLKSSLLVFRADSSGNSTGGPLPVTITTEGDSTIVISDLIEGQTYALVVRFVSPYPTDHPQITGAFRVTKVE